MKLLLIYLPLFSFFLLGACTAQKATDSAKDPLPSWNEGKVKTAIISFVESANDKNSNGFIPVKDRVATFDNDGNLWSEKPFYFQLKFAIDKVKAMADQHPEWKDTYPFKAVLEDDMDKLLSFGHHGLLELVMATHAGMTDIEFAQSVKAWLASNPHPRFNKAYNELIYQPMIELIHYLQDNNFKTFIVSGGGIDFMRVWAEEAYNIPVDQIVGSSLKAEFVADDQGVYIKKLPEIHFIDDKGGKPVGIHQHIGKIPVFASGNSDGDLQMLQYTASGDGPRFMLYLHHTDSIREWAYDRNSAVGRLDKGLDIAKEKGWSIIDMKRDWKVIYPHDQQ